MFPFRLILVNLSHPDKVMICCRTEELHVWDAQAMKEFIFTVLILVLVIVLVFLFYKTCILILVNRLISSGYVC